MLREEEQNTSEARVRGVKACTMYLFNLSHEGILEIIISLKSSNNSILLLSKVQARCLILLLLY